MISAISVKDRLKKPRHRHWKDHAGNANSLWAGKNSIPVICI